MSKDGYSFIEGEEGELDRLADLTPKKSQESLSASQNASQKEHVYLYEKLDRNWNEEFQVSSISCCKIVSDLDLNSDRAKYKQKNHIIKP